MKPLQAEAARVDYFLVSVGLAACFAFGLVYGYVVGEVFIEIFLSLWR